MTGWRRSSTSSTTWGCGCGRMAPAGAATAFSMPCTSRSCMTSSGQRGGCSCTGALASGWRRGMAPGRGDRRPARGHFERGGATAQAVRYAQQAADNAARRNAHHEASTALTKGLALLATLPDLPSAPGTNWRCSSPWGAVADHAGAGGPGGGRRLHPGLYPGSAGGGDAAAHSGPLGPVAVSYEPGADGARRRVGAAAPRSSATPARHVVRGGGAFSHGGDGELSGGLPRRRAQLEQSYRLADSVPSPAPFLHGGMVSEVPLRIWLARVLWALGYADQAQQRSQEAVALAQQMQHTPSLAYAELSAALLSIAAGT